MCITEEHYADDCQAYYHLFNNDKGMQYKPDVFAEKLELLGIYGVHYEFTNDCEAPNA